MGAKGDLDPSTAVSNTYDMEWPPRSGRIQSFPEIDRVEWFDLDEARRQAEGGAGAVPGSAPAGRVPTNTAGP